MNTFWITALAAFALVWLAAPAALTPTGRFVNWTAVAFNGTVITGIKRVGIDWQITDIRDSADMDMGPTLSLITQIDPRFTLNTTAAFALIANLSGVPGIFTATAADARNKAATGGGGLIFTTNALSYIGQRTNDGAYNTLMTEDMTILTTWSDGVTSPVAVAAA